MYDFKYQYLHQSGSTPESKYKNKTVLRAIFLFGNEVTPNERKEVRERCRLFEKSEKVSSGHYRIKEGQLDGFLKRTLHYQPCPTDSLRGKEYFGHREVLTVTPLLLKLGFKIKSKADGQLPLEEMIDMSALNHFVLTGKYPEVEEQDQIRDLQEQMH